MHLHHTFDVIGKRKMEFGNRASIIRWPKPNRKQQAQARAIVLLDLLTATVLPHVRAVVVEARGGVGIWRWRARRASRGPSPRRGLCSSAPPRSRGGVERRSRRGVWCAAGRPVRGGAAAAAGAREEGRSGAARSQSRLGVALASGREERVAGRMGSASRGQPPMLVAGSTTTIFLNDVARCGALF